MNPLIMLLSHRPLSALADVLREQAEAITREWDGLCRQATPEINRLSYEELKDSVPAILDAIADALASDDVGAIEGLRRRSPSQGLTRFRQRYGPEQILREDALLRAVIVARCEAGLGRALEPEEATPLHTLIDLMTHQSVLALIEAQTHELREANARELKYLSFLSHDLANHLSGVTMTLGAVRRELRSPKPSTRRLDDLLGAGERAIDETTKGMRALLDHERLRHAGEGPRREAMNARAYLSEVAAGFEAMAEHKGLTLRVEAAPDLAIETDPMLASLVLRNLTGNAIKYSPAGCVRLTAEERTDDPQFAWTLSVSDEGPGIAEADQARIFEAFSRGEAFGQEGTGLGLAIASQAARLLEARLTCRSTPGAGSTFTLALPRTAEKQ